jgi:hypothetical protein
MGRRLKQLKFLIEDGSEKEKSLKAPKWVLQVSKRVHLVELTAKYMEEVEAEKAAPKKRGRPSVKERFTNLLSSADIIRLGNERRNTAGLNHQKKNYGEEEGQVKVDM